MTITMQRAMYILGHAYGLNGCRGIATLFQGAPGGGKTTLMHEFANKYLNGNIRTLEVSRMQGTDLMIPIPDHAKKRVDFYASGDIQDLAASDTGMLFGDELTRPADQGSLAAMLNVFLEHRLGQLDFRHIIVWAACNPAAQVGGIELDPAFMNRLVVVDWPEDTDVESYTDHMNAIDAVSGKRAGNEWPAAPAGWEKDWPEAWAKANTQVCAFLRVQTGLLTEECPTTARPWRSKRSWHTATNVLAACILHNANTTETRTLMKGAIGEEAAHAFLAWRVNNDLPDPKDVVAGKVAIEKLNSDKMFLALMSAADYFLAQKAKGNGLPTKPFIDVLEACCDKNMEVVAPVAGRLAKAKVTDPVTVKLYQKVLPTK